MTPPRRLTDVPGIAVGHATDLLHLTGCTVVVCERGAVAGVAVLGAAPGTRETDLLRPENLVTQVHAVVLAGGSAFGLAAADGAMRWLAARGVGFATRDARVPIVPAAVLYDLGIGDPSVRPDAAMGEQACREAGTADVAEGCVGAGTGATVGKLFGMSGAMKSGVGTWSVRLAGGVTLGALVATNAFGDVVDPATGTIVAGARDPATGRLAGMSARLGASGRGPAGFGHEPGAPGRTEHTTLGVVATDAALTKAQAARLAVAGHMGLARAVRPSHTSVDGDVMFGLGTGTAPCDPIVLESAASDVVAEAIVRSVRAARSLGGVPGLARSAS
jgi:L-aminopeptidase/D-esterase-like protein